MRERYFLDANVLFTAAIAPHGTCRAIVDLARVEACSAGTSRFAYDEAHRNVRLKYSDRLAVLESLLDVLVMANEAPQTIVRWAAQHLPPKDAPILAAAVASRSQVLVTGDRRHFGALYGVTLESVSALSPRDALERLL